MSDEIFTKDTELQRRRMSDEIFTKDTDLFARVQRLTQTMLDAEKSTIPLLTREILDEQALSTYVSNRDRPGFLEVLGLEQGNIIDRVLEMENMLVEHGGMSSVQARNFFDDETFMNLLEEEMRQGKAVKDAERAD